MQLDKTRIVTRERDYLDILDLALRVVREFAGPLFLALAAGVAPAMILNAWILAGYSDQDFEMGFPFLYTLFMTLLVGYQVPLVTAPAAVFLGEAVFSERPRSREIIKKLFRGLPQLFLYEGLLRWWYWPWTYLSEVILLEQNPLRGKARGSSPRGNESHFLHRGHGGDLFARASSRCSSAACSLPRSGGRSACCSACCSANGSGAIPHSPASTRCRCGSWWDSSAWCDFSPTWTCGSAVKGGKLNC